MITAATFFKALGDETRLKMLWLLMNRRELCVCDLMEVLNTTQSKASRHLRTLYHTGLVNSRRQGQWMYYSLRSFQDDLVRLQMRTLKKALTDNTDAEALLARLDVWLNKKEAGRKCQ
jgi:ArsR family transcriptional regulator